MPLSAADFERLFNPGTRHRLSNGDVVTVRLRQGASLWLPSGRVVAAEPFGFDVSDGFIQRVPPGQYPLVLVLVESGEGVPHAYEMIAAARLVIRDEPVVSWEMAVYEGQDVSELGERECFCYPVDGGTGSFIDATSIAPLQDNDYYVDRLMMALDIRETDYTAPATLTDDEGRTLLVAFSSGDGDGHYPTWVGRTADGEVACFLTDFFVLTGNGDANDDGNDEAPSADEAGPRLMAVSEFAQGHEMRAGQTLRRQSLTSRSGRYTLVHQDDGNLVLYNNVHLRPSWASDTNGRRGSFCALRERDGLVLFNADGRRIWSTGAERPAARLVVRDDGDVVIEDTSGAKVWSSGTSEVAVPEGPVAIGHQMLPGQTLGRQSLTSRSGRYTLVHQDDGNLVLYNNKGRGAVWASGTQGRGTARCQLQADGDFVVYDKQARVVWSTGTAGNPGSVLVVCDDGVELRGSNGTVLWSVRAAWGTGPAARSQSPSEPTSAGTASSMQRPFSPTTLARAAVKGVPLKPASRATPMRRATPAAGSDATAEGGGAGSSAPGGD